MTEQTNTSTAASPTYSPLKFDREQFRKYVQDMELSVAQQDALLESVWLIVVGVIDLGLGLHPFCNSVADSKPLAVDLSGVLALLSDSKTSDQKDATAEMPNVPRMDS
jgi:hypothetical protein